MVVVLFCGCATCVFACRYTKGREGARKRGRAMRVKRSGMGMKRRQPTVSERTRRMQWENGGRLWWRFSRRCQVRGMISRMRWGDERCR